MKYHRDAKSDFKIEVQSFGSFFPGFGITVGTNNSKNYYTFPFLFNNKMNHLRKNGHPRAAVFSYFYKNRLISILDFV